VNAGKRDAEVGKQRGTDQTHEQHHDRRYGNRLIDDA